MPQTTNTSATIALGITGIAGWVSTFGLGLLVNSGPYRSSVATEFNWQPFLLSLLTYTPTNVALLCLLAALCGGCASRLIQAEATQAHAKPHNAPTDSDIYRRENPFSSMFRGFLVFIAFLAGVYAGTSSPFADTSPEQYARAAGTTSLVAFSVGYDPTLFEKVLSLGGKLRRND